LISGGILGFAYKNKLLFDYNFSRVSDKIEHGKIGVDAVKSDITNLAKQSSDIVDILILNNNNQITFSAKSSKFSDEGVFNLDRAGEGENRFFTFSQDSDITFILLKKDELMLSTVFDDRDRRIQNSYRDNIFFEDNINSKKLYLLSYTFDKATGDKIYFISDIHPVHNGPLYLNIVFAVLIFFLMLYWVLVALWVYQNARKAKINALLWGIITLCTNIAGLLIYLIYKQNNQICHNCGALQNKGNIHCIHCGVKINKTCKNCNAIINEDDGFCHHCGKLLQRDDR
jgi:RNA polymerase subunit RPABC4/transcription elongation factor Spt4